MASLQIIGVLLGCCVIICHGLAPLFVSNMNKFHRKKQSLTILPHAATYELTRSLYFRSLGGVYLTAFLIAKNQNKALIGDHGLMPARDFLMSTEQMSLSDRPISLLYGVKDKSNLNFYLDLVSITGMVLAAIPFIFPQYAIAPIWAALWILYHSLDTVGGPFYSYMWESQLLETGFLAMCVAPLYAGALPAPAWFGISSHRWLMFRIMLGAGLIKLRGDDCWKCWNPQQPSCLEYHYETQPVPGPLAPLLHFMPKWFHRGGTWSNHVVELVLVWLLLLPPWTKSLARLGAFGGLVQLTFQSILIASGNLSFLNVLTCVPAIWCFDDAFLSSVFSSSITLVSGLMNKRLASALPLRSLFLRHTPYVLIAVLLASLSVRVIENLRSDRQVMNTTFGSIFRLVNSYGAFGSVGRDRDEMIISGASHIPGIGASEDAWKEYVFAVKPGPVDRPLPFIVPYHHRLDWCIWLLTLQSMYQPAYNMRYPKWLYRFLLRLLQNDPDVTALLADGGNPFHGKEPPVALKVERFRYTFASSSSSSSSSSSNILPGADNQGSSEHHQKQTKNPVVWTREKIGPFFPHGDVITADMLREYD